MPNWCEGNIRFRGTYENIKRFLMNEIVACKYGTETGETIEEKPIIEDDDYRLIFTLPTERHWFYFRNTRRHFIDGENPVEIWIDKDSAIGGQLVVCVDRFKAAWSLQHHEAWLDIAKRYDIDVKMWGYERGMNFEQVKIILRDGTVKEEMKEYEWDRWAWECPMPNFGG